MIEFTDQQFKEVKEKGEELYKSLGEVFCPFLKEKVSFGAQGLEHLKFKRREKARLEKDQYMRFKLLRRTKETKNPPEAGSLLAFGYNLEAVRGRTLQTP